MFGILGLFIEALDVPELLVRELVEIVLMLLENFFGNFDKVRFWEDSPLRFKEIKYPAFEGDF